MDIVLTVCFWIIQAAMAGLGVYVSMRPPESHRHRLYIVAFCCLGLSGLAVNIWQQVRAGDSQKLLQGQIGRIERNTKTPPTVQVTNIIPPAQIAVGALRSFGTGGFDLSIDGVTFRGTSPSGSAIIEVSVLLHNNGPDSVVSGWNLEIVNSSKSTTYSHFLPGRTYVTGGAISLDERLGNSVLIAGGSASGPVSFIVNGADYHSLAMSDSNLILSVRGQDGKLWRKSVSLKTLRSQGIRETEQR